MGNISLQGVILQMLYRKLHSMLYIKAYGKTVLEQGYLRKDRDNKPTLLLDVHLDNGYYRMQSKKDNRSVLAWQKQSQSLLNLGPLLFQG